MLKRLLLAIVVAIGALLAYASTRPDTFQVQRSAVIAAPAAAIYPMIVDLRRWAAWSPYEKLDPQMQKTYAGPPAGPGSSYAWKGNSKAGAGNISVTEASEPSRVAMKLNMVEPISASNDVEFLLAPEGDGTRLTWTMRGQANLVSKTMGVFFDMDKMVGTDFENGLSNLKSIAEKKP